MTVRRTATLAVAMGMVVATLAAGPAAATSADTSPGSTIGTVPPDDPSVYCQPALPDLVTVIDYCRAQEGVGPLALPVNFAKLTPQEQMFVLLDLERVNRGERPVTALSASLDDLAQQGAVVNDDPPFPPNVGGGGIWAPTTSTLWADDAFMYTDDCTPTNVKDCWGHRNIILDNSDTTDTLVGGAGYVPKNLDNTWNSYTFEFIYGYTTQDYVFSWSGELGNFATPPAIEPLQPPTVTSVSPSAVSAAGGQVVTITGTDLVSTTWMAVDGVSATHVSCLTETRCTAVVPAHLPGPASLAVTAAGGTSQPSSGATLTYAKPHLTRIGAARNTVSVGRPFGHPLQTAVSVAGKPAARVPVTFTVTGPVTFPGGRRKVTVATASNGVATSPQVIAAKRAGSAKAGATAPSGANTVAWTLIVRS